MSIVPRFSALRYLQVFLLILSAWITHAAEPTGMMSMTDKQFAEWVVGTEWSFTYKAGEKDGQKRKVWFVTPDVCFYTKVNETGRGGQILLPWKIGKRGSISYFHDMDAHQEWIFTIALDLKSASLRTPENQQLKVSFNGRRSMGASVDMTREEFTSWLRGAKVDSGENQTADFPNDGKIRIRFLGREINLNINVVQPGIIRYYWEENSLDPNLMIFSADLRTVKCYHKAGLHDGKIEVTDEAKATTKEFTSGKTSMDNLKPVPLLASAASVKALLVRELGNSRLSGSASTLSISALPLQSDAPATIAFNQDVGRTMGRALKEVARYVALRHGGWPKAQEMQLSFDDKYGAKDGPSAAAACALLLDGLFTAVKLDPEFAITGDLNSDGSIQPIGGVQAKLRGATRLKCKLLGIPVKNAPQATDIALTEGLKPFMDIQVFTPKNFEEALALGRADKAPELASAISDFAALIKSTKGDPRALKTPESGEQLRSVLKRAPTHFSAQVLLLAAAGKLPKTLSPAGTLAEVDQAVGDLKTAIGGDLTTNTKLNSGQVTTARSGLVKLRPLADPRVRPLLDAWAAWGNLADTIVRGGGTLNAKQLQEWKTAGNRITVEEEKLRSNEAFSEDLE